MHHCDDPASTSTHLFSWPSPCRLTMIVIDGFLSSIKNAGCDSTNHHIAAKSCTSTINEPYDLSPRQQNSRDDPIISGKHLRLRVIHPYTTSHTNHHRVFINDSLPVSFSLPLLAPHELESRAAKQNAVSVRFYGFSSSLLEVP